MKKIILTIIALFAVVGLVLAACPATKGKQNQTHFDFLMSKFMHKHTNVTTKTPIIATTTKVTSTPVTKTNPTVTNKTTFETEILATHNKYRSEVGVPPLTWCPTLASGAKEWANYLAANKLFEHSPKPRSYGENIHWNTAGKKTYPQMMDGWYGEKAYFKNGVYPNCTTNSTKVIGHYTQMVWRNTKQVGCGVGTGNGRDVLVCRYSPPGNTIGQKVY